MLAWSCRVSVRVVSESHGVSPRVVDFNAFSGGNSEYRQSPGVGDELGIRDFEPDGPLAGMIAATQEDARASMVFGV